MVTGKQHLRLTGFAVLAETVLLELVLNERFKVERRAKTIRSEALAARVASPVRNRQLLVEPTPSPAAPEILLKSPDAASLAVGDARHTGCWHDIGFSTASKPSCRYTAP